jgi:hypothetical protein
MPSGDLSSTATTLQIRDATQVVLLLTAITDIREYTLTEGTTPDGADDALAVNFNVVLDDDTELPISTELGTGEVILG